MNIGNWDTYTAKALTVTSDLTANSKFPYDKQQARSDSAFYVIRMSIDALINAIQDATKAADKAALTAFLKELRKREAELYEHREKLDKATSDHWDAVLKAYD